jgi:hypothetical protein
LPCRAPSELPYMRPILWSDANLSTTLRRVNRVDALGPCSDCTAHHSYNDGWGFLCHCRTAHHFSRAVRIVSLEPSRVVRSAP